MDNILNSVILHGTLLTPPRFSHEGRDGSYYIFTLSAKRLSRTADDINVLVRESLLRECELETGDRVSVTGELRSFNNKSGEGSRLVITVFAREIEENDSDDVNETELRGVLCRPPNRRRTPMGRDICDLMLAVRRKYGRSDYIPCIAWGRAAEEASHLEVGDSVYIKGRIQSRRYTKTEEGKVTERTAFEVSATELTAE